MPLRVAFPEAERPQELLPPLLKKISVIHYLNSLVPVPLSEGPLAVVVEPTPAWISVPGLLIVTALVLFLAGTRIAIAGGDSDYF